MVDILPECLIHKILSYLSIEEAAPFMILSKTWLRAWLANPSLQFILHSDRDVEKVGKIMETYRHTKNPIDKFDFQISISMFDYPIDQFQCLINKWLEIALENGVKVVVCEYPYKKYGSVSTLPLFTILAANSLRELVVSGFDLSSLSSGVVNCYSLINLSLTNVRLNDSMLQTLLTCCPLIVTLFLKHCIELKKIELRNLQKIKSISIYGPRELCVIIQAPTLEHLSCVAGYIVDIVECHNLKSLALSHVRISFGLLEHVISTCQSLESLILGYFYYKNSEKLLIKSQSLRTLKISNCAGKVAIDAPNLIEYKGERQFPELKMPKDSNQLKLSTISFVISFKLDVAWFCKLRNFLSNSASLSRVSLCLSNCHVINGEELQQSYHRVATSQVDVLDVIILSHREYDESFVDALLWSCHPRRFNLSSSVDMITCFMDRLMHMKNSFDSSASGSKHWFSRLKQVKAYQFDGQKLPVEFTNVCGLKDSEEVKVYFLLDW